MAPDLKRIAEMEGHLDACNAAAEELRKGLDGLDEVRDRMSRLFGYYGSPEWYSDREGELPEGFRAGVLSEDSVYDAVSDIRDLCFRMLEAATDILKNRI